MEGAIRGAGEERKGDDSHRFLRVVCPMAVGHPGSAYELEFAKDPVHEVRCVGSQDETSRNMSKAPTMKPAIGEVIIGTTTLGRRPVRHFRTEKSPLAVARALRRVRRSGHDSSSTAGRAAR